MNTTKTILAGIGASFVILSLSTLCFGKSADDSSRPPEKKTTSDNPPENSPAVNVVFDTAPGVVIVEVAGERLKINTTTKTVERFSVTEAAQTQQSKEPAYNSTQRQPVQNVSGHKCAEKRLRRSFANVILSLAESCLDLFFHPMQSAFRKFGSNFGR